MRNFTALRSLYLAACLLPLFGVSARAADDADQPDPPDRVARLSLLKGAVSVQAADEDEATPASPNRPLTTGDRLRLERDARAELQVGDLDVHVDEQSDFSFLELTDDVAQVRLAQGALHLSVRRIQNDEVIEVDTPQAAVTITKPGEYSIVVRDNGIRTTVKTYSGEVSVTDDKENVAIRSGEQANFFSAEFNAARQAAVQPIEPRSAFDSWAQDRNRGYERSASAKYVAPDVIGYRDLDDNGEWIDDSDYGHIWYPTRVAVDWSPYRFGHWVWVSPWGWTWVDDAPWGFAPFHYGRWAFVRSRWCWVPGPIHVRAVYAPALVAWVGAPPPRGVRVSVSIGGGIGWFPLAPREVFVPGYHASRTHIHNVNYANTVIVNNVYINRVYANRATHFDYANRHVKNGVTVVKTDVFSGSRPVRDHMVRVDPRELDTWRTRNAAPQVQPPHVTRVDARPNERKFERDVVMRHAPERPGFTPGASMARNREARPADAAPRENVTRNDLSQRRWNGSQTDPRARPAEPARTDSQPRNQLEPRAQFNQPRGDQRAERPDAATNPRDFNRGQFERREVDRPRMDSNRFERSQPPAQSANPAPAPAPAPIQQSRPTREQFDRAQSERRSERHENFQTPRPQTEQHQQMRAPQPAPAQQPPQPQQQAQPQRQQHEDRGNRDGHARDRKERD